MQENKRTRKFNTTSQQFLSNGQNSLFDISQKLNKQNGKDEKLINVAKAKNPALATINQSMNVSGGAVGENGNEYMDNLLSFSQENFTDQTICDYRHYMNQRGPSFKDINSMRKDSFFRDVTFLMKSDRKLQGEGEITHHCHSDLDMEEDPDPFYEYNKCNEMTLLEKKTQSKFETFNPIEISRFTFKRREAPQS